MAHIVEFTVDGLAGRKEPLKQKLDRHVNVFFGLNGSGKTSLLRILDSAMSARTRSIELVPFESAEVSIFSINHDTTFVRTIHKNRNQLDHSPRARSGFVDAGELVSDNDDTVTDGHLPVSSQESFQWKTTGLPSDASDDFRHTYLPTWRSFMGSIDLSPQRDSLRTRMEEGEEIYWDRLFAERLEYRWGQFTNQLLSEVQQIQGEGLASVLRGFLARSRRQLRLKELDAEDAYDRVNTFLERQGSPRTSESRRAFSKRYADDPQLRQVVSDINSVEEKIAGTMASRDNLEKLILGMFSGNKTLKFENSGISVETTEGEHIRLASLSSGEKQALRMFIDTLLVHHNSLLIDEPELSLHVDWQRILIHAMRQLNPDTQLILATHSPEIMADVDDDNIFRL